MNKSLKILLFVIFTILMISTSLVLVYDPFNFYGNDDYQDNNNNFNLDYSFSLHIDDYPGSPTGYESLIWNIVEPGNIPIDNPLKGFMPYERETESFPHSLEYTYIAVDEVVGDSSTDIDFNIIEEFLNRVSSRGHQGVFRLYFDYPGEDTAVPQYLIDAGLTMNSYTQFGGGFSPDYDDPMMIELMENLIAALGYEYDGDPRVGFIQIGLLGHWGEWHTYPTYQYFPSFSTQHKVLETFDNAFNRTMILARYPDSITAPYNVGYHDDSFAYSTLGPQDWHFYPLMENSGTTERWKTHVIGGEVRPEVQIQAFRNDLGESQNISECILTTHASWMLETGIFEESYLGLSATDSDLQQAAYVSTLFGYTFAVCYYNTSFNQIEDEFALSVVVHNFGVAPFYYNWSVEFGIIDENNATLQSELTDITINGILPGNSVVWEYTYNSISSYESGNFLSLRVPNRMDDGEPVRFANKNITTEGWVKISQI